MKSKHLLICLFLGAHASAQTPVSETIHANSIEAKVWSNGALFGYGNERSFKIPKSDNNDSIKVPVFRNLVPWMGGYNEFGSQRVACASPTGTTTDFVPGIMGQEGYNQVWKVTKAQINAHRADFQDNGVIDNPIPEIINWPGTVLVHPYVFDTGYVNATIAPFYETGNNHKYDPLAGDFPHPSFGNSAQELIKIPDEMLFFTYHDYTVPHHPATLGQRLGMQILCTVWAYYCPEDTFFNNSLFVNVEYWNRSADVLDSLHAGFLMNVELGNSNDNFIGSDPDEHIFYTYNGDANDEGGFEENPPMVSVFTLGAYVYTMNSFDVAAEYFMPIREPGSSGPTGSAYPNTPGTFYNYLTGRWKDNTPLREGGNGYHPNEALPAVRCAYPGNLTETGEWSELTAANTPGRRMALISVPASKMSPYTRMYRSFCFTWLRPQQTPASMESALDFIRTKKHYLSDLWLAWDSEVEYPVCSMVSSDNQVSQSHALQVYPNPGSGIFRIISPNDLITAIVITDLSGKTRYDQSHMKSSDFLLDLPLPSGVYFLTVLTDTNQRHTQKIVVVQ